MRKAAGRLLRLPAQCTLADADGLKLTLARLLGLEQLLRPATAANVSQGSTR